MNDLAQYFVKPALIVCGTFSPFLIFALLKWLGTVISNFVDALRCHGEIVDLRVANRELGEVNRDLHAKCARLRSFLPGNFDRSAK